VQDYVDDDVRQLADYREKVMDAYGKERFVIRKEQYVGDRAKVTTD